MKGWSRVCLGHHLTDRGYLSPFGHRQPLLSERSCDDRCYVETLCAENYSGASTATSLDGMSIILAD